MSRWIALASAFALSMIGGSAAAQTDPTAPFAPVEPTVDVDAIEPRLNPLEGNPGGDSADLITEPAGVTSPDLSRQIEVNEERDRLLEVAEELQFYDFDADIDLNTDAYTAPGPAEPNRVQFILE
ncbi:MAG: hypothetical protein ACFB8W_18345 [Elainellaceae cyanobacterium]